jgi:hypothetical protein
MEMNLQKAQASLNAKTPAQELADWTNSIRGNSGGGSPDFSRHYSNSKSYSKKSGAWNDKFNKLPWQ